MYTFLDIVVIILSIITIQIVTTLIKTHRRRIFGIYQRPTGFYWLKVAFLYLILSIRKFSSYRKYSKTPKDVEYKKYTQMECPQKLSCDENAIDAVYFNCANQQSDHLVVGTARRKNRLIDGFIYLKINNEEFGLLENPNLPDTSLYQNEDVNEYSVEGIKIYPIEPMKKWKIIYEGKMKKHEKPEELLDVKIDATWTSYLPYFNFDDHMNPLTMAKSIANEQWSREYFKTLKAVHQTHYEQHGDLTGMVTVNGKPYKIYMTSLRDHSYGISREWRLFHRYGIHFLTTENGDRFNVGIVAMPICFSRLIIGYVYSAADKKIYAVEDCDLKLYQHGEDGEPPLDYAFSFKAGGKRYIMEVDVTDSPTFYISKDWESKVVERLCKFKVNGIDGWGAAEWVYRNVKGRRIEEKRL